MYKPFLLAGGVILALSVRERKKQQQRQHQAPTVAKAVRHEQDVALVNATFVVWAAHYQPALVFGLAGACAVLLVVFLLAAIVTQGVAEVEVTASPDILLPHVSYEPQPPKVQDLSGTWIKDREQSESMEAAMDLARLNGFVKLAVRRIKGMQIQQTPHEFKLVILSGILSFKVVETYPMNGDSRRYKRRDLRRGQHTGHVKATPDGRLRAHLIWGEPLGGLGCDEFSIAEPGHWDASPASLTTTFTRSLLSDVAVEEDDTRRIFTQDLARSIPALLLALVIGALATAAGVGGGAFFVPLFNVLLQFTIKGSTAMSQAVITGGALAGVAYQVFKRHPLDPSKPLIDYTLALMLTPVLLLGVSIGVLMNVLFPVWLVTFLLVILLLYLTHMTLRKGLSLRKAETKAKAAAAAAASSSAGPDAGQHAEHGGGVAPGGSTPKTEALAGSTLAASKHKDMNQHNKGGDSQSSSGSPGQPQRVKVGVPGMHPDAAAQLQADSPAGSVSALNMLRNSMSGLPFLPDKKSLSSSSAAEPVGSASASPSSQRITVDAVELTPVPHEPPQRLTPAGRYSNPEDESHDEEHADPASAAEEPSAQFLVPWMQMLQILVLWGAFLTLQLLKSFHSRCTAAYFALYGAQALLAGTTSCWFVHQAYKRQIQEAQSQLRRPILKSIYEEPPEWTMPRLIRASIVALVGGAIAGLLGIGGGMIINPLLLQLGIHPQVSAATSTLMVLFSGSSAALSFGFDHALNLQYALIFGLGCFATSFVGVIVVARIIKKSGKASLLVMLLAGIIATGALFTAVFAGRKAIVALKEGVGLGFSPFCPKHSA
ncbi:hypothetical protein WJX72_002354 [[Myrmecia] bisecta]|uniref:Uncharacterized protein n=1 Tax=[Myrmecia] bisecta TaxID=41462 RepID=A0AAW1PJM5_9CHLO